MIHLNAHSILHHLDEIQNQFNGYDVIAITESWLTPRCVDCMLTFFSFV